MDVKKYRTAIWLGLIATLTSVYYFIKQSKKIPMDFQDPDKLKDAYLVAINDNFRPLNAQQIESLNLIIDSFLNYGDKDPRKLNYIIATAIHESGLRPIKEYRAKEGTRVYELQQRYWPSGYYGRGFVQLTWERNYKKMSDFIGVDLVADPDLALNPRYAADILVYGMLNGSFTRKGLGQYINPLQKDYFNARKTVNGLDRAELIASYAENIEGALPFNVA